jgi:hypothetical protein
VRSSIGAISLIEAHAEHVVQSEREPLRRAEFLQHDTQRQAHGVGLGDRSQRAVGDGLQMGSMLLELFGLPVPPVRGLLVHRSRLSLFALFPMMSKSSARM